jgi:hypothetical protein
MPDLTASTSDGWARASGSNFANARNSETASVSNNSNVSSATGISAYSASSRGVTTWYVLRSLFTFDTSSISVAPATAILKLYGNTNTSGDLIVLSASADETDYWDGLAVGGDNYNDFNGWSDSDPWSAGDTIAYSSVYTGSWSTVAYNEITLLPICKSHMASKDSVELMVVNAEYDYGGKDPDGESDTKLGIFYAEESGKEPLISYTVGYGHTVSGVTTANISKVKGVATASIDKVIGVD